MQKSDNDYMVLYFHSHELEARYNALLPKGGDIFKSVDGVESIAAAFMQEINGFGRDLWLPLKWLFGVSLPCFAVFYYWTSGVGVNDNLITDAPLWLQKSKDSQLGLSIIYSLKQTFGPLGLFLNAGAISPVNGLLKFISTIHFILCTIIWFLLILQIRNRFKL